MIRALGWHTWLLLTLRHDGKGLPAKSCQAVFGAFGLCVALAVLRWNGVHPATHTVVGMIITLCLVSWFSVRAATGYAMISAAVDLFAIAIPPFDVVSGFVEAAASLALFARLALEWSKT